MHTQKSSALWVKFTAVNVLFETKLLPHHQHFPDVIPSQKELTRGEVIEKILDVAIIEDSLQATPVDRLQFQDVWRNDVVS